MLSKFRTKSSVNTSIASRFHPTGVTALKSRAASKDKSLPSFLTAGIIAFDLCSHIKPIAYLIVGCMPKQIETQSPLWQRSSRSCQDKCSKIVKLVTNYKAILVRFLHRSNRFFTTLKHRFTQRRFVYNFCPNENKPFHRISTVSKHRSFTNNRGSEIKKWKVRRKPIKTTLTSQIGSAKIGYKSLLHRMTLFKFNLCRDIEKNPGPGARRHFMN